jgi:NAD(P)H-hydrate epimerase
MRLVTAREMQQIDRATIDGGLVPSLVLMERAGQAAAREARSMLGSALGTVEILCGKGNNGGDGLVVARALAEHGLPVRVHLTHAAEHLSADARANLERLAGLPVTVQQLPPTLADPGPLLDPRQRPGWAGSPPAVTGHAATDALGAELHGAALCVDALLGTGVAEPVRDRLASLIHLVNHHSRHTLAIDIPSGVDGSTGAVEGAAIWADRTVTFGLPKVGLVLFPGRERTGALCVADIGFPADVVEAVAPRRHWVEFGLARTFLPRLEPTAHKYTRGCVIVLAGSREFPGAAALASTAALRAGAGMVHLCVPQSMRALLQAKLTEVIVHGVPETAEGTAGKGTLEAMQPLLERADALAIGPGLGAVPATLSQVRQLLVDSPLPAVVDADAITAIPLTASRGSRIATPHAGELARWTGRPTRTDMERLEAALDTATSNGIVVLAKGAPTFVAGPDGSVYVNSSGHAGLATAGSGDVLTGIVAGLLAQGVDAIQAASLAAFLHGRAAELATLDRAPRSLLAGDLLLALGTALAELES